MSELLSGLSSLMANESFMKIIIFAVVIFFIVAIVRSLMKIAMPIAVIGLVMVVFLGFSPEEVMNKGKQLASFSGEFFKENLLPLIENKELNNESNLNSDQNRQEEIFDKSIVEERLKQYLNKGEENKVEEMFDSIGDESLFNEF